MPETLHEHTEDGLLFSTDRRRLDIGLIHDFLARESYWVPGIRRAFVEAAIEPSICAHPQRIMERYDADALSR